MTATPQALAAIKAAQHGTEWGERAMWRFLERNGVPLRLYFAAQNFEFCRKSPRPSKRRKRDG